MPDFDDQWSKVMNEEHFTINRGQYECNENRVKEFLKLTGIKSRFKKDSFVKGKICLDAGCGPGRWTCAMQLLGAKKVVSFDISPEAIKRSKEINPDAYVFNLWDLEPNPIYDFVLSWGVLMCTEDTRKAFSKVASQVKKGGMLHVMIYDKKMDWMYDGFRGTTCVEKHKIWEKLSWNEKLEMCKKMAKKYGGEIHGWFDALNPTYNWSHSADEVKRWFIEDGFTNMKVITKGNSNINMNGILA